MNRMFFAVIAVMAVHGLGIFSAHGVTCKKLEPSCTTLETLDRHAPDDYCTRMAAEKQLFGCVHVTRNVPEHPVDYEESFSEEEAAFPGRYTWQCLGCNYPQPQE